MVRWGLLLIFGVIVGLVCAIFNLPFWMAVVLFVLLALSSMVKLVYNAYLSTNLTKIKAYIEKNKKDPFLNYLLIVENGTKEQEIEAMDKIIAHYKQPTLKNTYAMNKAIRLEDFGQAHQFANMLMKTPYGPYGKALIAAVQGNRAEAKRYELKSPWMNDAIEAALALSENNEQAFDKFASKTIEGTKGLQRFSNVHSLKKARAEHNAFKQTID